MRLNYIDCIDCLEGMKAIPDGSVDMVLCDLPYGTTRNKWDSVISFEALWKQYRRVVRPDGVIALFADGLFMAQLITSNPDMWRYNLVWDKVLTTGFLNANKMPLRKHEQICIFYQKVPKYNPQKTLGQKSHSRGKKKTCVNNNYGEYDFVDNGEKHGTLKYPNSILTFQKPHPSKAVHPTQKPVELCEYLIKTYTDPGQVVLDNCMGSGTTAVACLKTDRNYIGFEMSPEYHAIAQKRIADTVDELLRAEV